MVILSTWLPRLRVNRCCWLHRSGFAGLALIFGLGACVESGGAYRRAPGVLANGVFTPAVPPSAYYGPGRGHTCAQPPAVKLILTHADEAAQRAQRPPAELDAQLCDVAVTLAGWDPSAGAPPEPIVAFLSYYFGLPETDLRVLVARLDSDDPQVISRRVANSLDGFAGIMAQPHFGVATSSLSNAQTVVALVVVDAVVALESVPRRLALGTTAVVGGKVLGGKYGASVVLISDVSGTLTTTRTPIVEPFKATVVCGDRPGRAIVQVRGERAGVVTPLATFPIECGGELPTSVTLPSPTAPPEDVAVAERQLLALLNQERVNAGVAPLELDDAVAQVARSASQRMGGQAKGQPAHDVDIIAQLRQANISSPVVLQNPARAGSVEGAHRTFATNPVHRSNMLNREATHAGIGVTVLPAATGQSPEVLVNEILVKERPRVDTQRVRDDLRAAIAQRRADAHAGELKEDPVLAVAVQKYAEALAANRGEVAKAQLDGIMAPVLKGFRAINIFFGAHADPLDFAKEPKIAADGKVLAVGAALGISPVLGKNAVFVVIFIATPGL